LSAAPDRSRDAAFGELFTEYRARVFALCFHLVGHAADAEDALQETFFAVHRGLPGFRGEAHLSTWIYRIALRVALRVKSRRPKHEANDRGNPAAEPAVTPEDPVIARERRADLTAALGRLPAEQQTVLSLFAVEGIPQKEIAAILGIPEGTVWSRLSAARRRLAAELARKAASSSGLFRTYG
jgi:RNA polymerase sigma-70 factor (ECF subfamily)